MADTLAGGAAVDVSLLLPFIGWAAFSGSAWPLSEPSLGALPPWGVGANENASGSYVVDRPDLARSRTVFTKTAAAIIPTIPVMTPCPNSIVGRAANVKALFASSATIIINPSVRMPSSFVAVGSRPAARRYMSATISVSGTDRLISSIVTAGCIAAIGMPAAADIAPESGPLRK